MGLTEHQRKQVEVIDSIEQQVNDNLVSFSTVKPVEDYANDPRLTLTSVHFPSQKLIEQIQYDIINPLKKIDPKYFYYSPASLHMTIKNVRVISDPPNFSQQDIEKATDVFSAVVPKSPSFCVFFYRLLMFKDNLSLIGTTDPQLDELVLNLDRRLSAEGVADDKKYINSSHFFCNMTLARFNEPPSRQFKESVSRLSDSLNFVPYRVDSVALVVCNAAFTRKRVIASWKLS